MTGPLQAAWLAAGRPAPNWTGKAADRARLLYSTRGAWTAADGQRVCAPCWDWSTLDVVSYLLHRGLPLCPVYDRLAELGVPEGAWRVGYMVGDGGARFGRYRWLRRGWPEEWARLAELVPWLREVS